MATNWKQTFWYGNVFLWIVYSLFHILACMAQRLVSLFLSWKIYSWNVLSWITLECAVMRPTLELPRQITARFKSLSEHKQQANSVNAGRDMVHVSELAKILLYTRHSDIIVGCICLYNNPAVIKWWGERFETHGYIWHSTYGSSGYSQLLAWLFKLAFLSPWRSEWSTHGRVFDKWSKAVYIFMPTCSVLLFGVIGAQNGR